MERTVSGLESLSLIIKDNSNCPICLEQIESQIISELSSCFHVMCEPCFKNMINFTNKCPLCLKIFTSCFYKDGSLILSEYFVTEKDMQNILDQRNSIYHGIYLI
jgi:hypothetical protein